MGTWWKDSPEVLARLLREHGQDPGQVTSVEAAWQAFCAFLRCPVDGLEPGPGTDADGFIVQCGRYGWNDRAPRLAFTRQFAVNVRTTTAEPDRYQPEYWQVSLDLVFEDAPALAGLDQAGPAGSGFDFCPAGPDRDGVLQEVERGMQQHPALRELWSSSPVRSTLALDCAD